MKKVLLLLVLASSQAYAENCLNRLTSQDSTDERYEMVLKCKFKNVSMGKLITYINYYGDSLCFGITKPRYDITSYKVVQFAEGEVGSRTDIVSVDSEGEVLKSSNSITLTDNSIAMTNKYDTFLHREIWMTESIIDMDNLELIFNRYDRKTTDTVGNYKKNFSANYTCEIL